MKKDGRNKNLNVFVLTTSFPLRADSVSGIFVKRLTDALKQKPCNLSIITPDSTFEAYDNPDLAVTTVRYGPRHLQQLAHESGGIPVQIRKKPWLVFLVPSLLISLCLHVLRRVRSGDVIHANWAVSGFVASFVRLFRNIGLVTTLRGEDVKPVLTFPSNLFLYVSMRYSDRIVLVSADMKPLLEKRYPRYKDKILVVNNGVDESFLSNQPASGAYSDNALELKLVSVGSLIVRKNIPFLIKTVSILEKRGIGVSLTLFGEGVEQPALKKLAESLGVSDKIFFEGVCSPAQLPEKLAHFPVYVSSSLHEGRPNAVIEAMASGCCVLLSDIDGHRDIANLSGAADLFRLDDERSLADCLSRYYGDRATLRLKGRLAREFIKQSGLTWNNTADKYLEVFTSVSGSCDSN